MSDIEDFHAMRSDERIMKYIQGRLAKTKEDSVKVIESGVEKLKEGNTISWAIRLKENKKLIGTIGFYRIQWDNFRGEVGYILHPDFQGKGLMTEALGKISDVGFRIFKFNTIEAELDPQNKASENLLIRNGFVKEGHFKEKFFIDGKFWDSMVYTKFRK